jgi:hypothetical protein
MDHPWKGRSLRVGLATASASALAFLALHHVVIRPIWIDAAPRAAAVVVVGGPLVAWCLGKAGPFLPVAPGLRGVWFGLLLVLAMLPFPAIGLMRHHGAADVQALGLGGLCVLVSFAVAFLGTGGRIRPFLFWLGPFVVLNGYPSWFLATLGENLAALGDRAKDTLPEPFVMVALLAAIEIVAAAGAWAFLRIARE